MARCSIIPSRFGPVRHCAARPGLVVLTDAQRLDAVALSALLPTLPPGTVVILRLHAPDRPEGLATARALAKAVRPRRIRLLVSGPMRLALAARAGGVHLPEALVPRAGRVRRPRRGLLISVAAHGQAALARGRRAGADLALLSPVFPTRSHPGRPALGPLRFGLLARSARGLNVLALGGITAAHARRLRPLRPDGWAAIDGWRR